MRALVGRRAEPRGTAHRALEELFCDGGRGVRHHHQPVPVFWQAGEEVEDEKDDPKAKPLIKAPLQAPNQLARIQLDTLAGTGISNVIGLFIMITTAATLNAHGVTDIQTSSQAAEALLGVSPLRSLRSASSAPACLQCRFSLAALTRLGKPFIGAWGSLSVRAARRLSKLTAS
jgi:hypothetical protein